MLHKLFSFFFWALFIELPAGSTLAQTPTPAACGCAQNFTEMRRLIETNYAGYRDKVIPATRPRLDSLTAIVRGQADTTRAGNCAKLLNQWLAFFRDGHVGVQNRQATTVDTATIRAYYASAERLPWTRATFHAYLDDPARPKRPLEGIWHDASGGDYEVGIVAAGLGQYKGFILRADGLYWMPGQVKFTFADPAAGPTRVTYYMRDHAPTSRRVQVAADGVLDIEGPWNRTYPRPVPVPAAPAGLSFQMLDDTTAFYRIASFDGRYRPRIDSLTRANAANLRRTKLLILDLRNNGGGSDGSYRSLAPYLYTQPMQEVGVQLWSTADNNRKYSGALFPNMSTREKLYFAHLRHRLDAHQGQFVRQGSSNPVQTTHLRPGKQHPALTRVAVLQNRGCGSTTEQFLLMARQSKKTTRFGENSYGSLDYANVQYATLPCDGLRLAWATSRSHRLDRGEGIDNIGIIPDVRLDPTAPTLVEQVRAWYRTKK